MKDEKLLELLGEALQTADPVPPAVLDAAKATFTWRTIDAELAALAFDSAAEELVGVRSTETTRQLTFSTPALEIELIVLTETSRRIVGQLVPSQEATIVLHFAGGERHAGTDELGRFSLDDVPTGVVRLSCTLGDGTVIQTEWTVL